MKAAFLARLTLLCTLAAALGCDAVPVTSNTQTTSATTTPSSPTPVTLVVSPPARRATAQPDTPAPSDNAVITVAGDSADTVTWVATSRRPWTTVLTGVGRGSGVLNWLRNTAGLGIGIYVDTITVTAHGAVDSPVILVDTLQITASPVPLTLAVSPASRSASTIQYVPVAGDNAGITISGDGAAAAVWTVTSSAAWDVLAAGTGTGSGTATWSRSIGGLAPGTYIDTLTVTAAGATGSPAYVLDTLVVTPPLSVTVNPSSTHTTAAQGTNAAGNGVAITLAGTGATTAGWTALKRHSWTSLTNAGGSGSGTLAWTHNAGGLVPGNYVDTITVSVPGAIGSPWNVIDTLTITAAPVPLTLAVSPRSKNVAITQGASAAAASATVTLTGDNATSATWNATKKKSWTTLTTGSGTGNGTVAWSRSTTSLGVGTFVDTITVTVNGATGSPATIIDSIVVSSAGGSGGGGGGGGGGVTADLGVNADLHGKQIFPAGNAWNQPVDTAQVDPNSNLILSTIGLGTSLHPDWGPTWGFPYEVIPDNTSRYTVGFDYANQSDPGPYPIPACPAIEGASAPCGPGSGDTHLLVITQNEWKLYEIFYLTQNGDQSWHGGSGAIFDLTNGTTRPAGWTSADAAGLPIFPGLVRYDEVFLHGAINHALRFTVQHTRNAYVAPASHVASSLSGTQYAPMGMRVRLKASFNISGYPAPMQVILTALKKYGMMVADNGSNFYVSGTIDPRWNDDYDNLLKQVHVSDFEVVKMNGVVTP